MHVIMPQLLSWVVYWYSILVQSFISIEVQDDNCTGREMGLGAGGPGRRGSR